MSSKSTSKPKYQLRCAKRKSQQRPKTQAPSAGRKFQTAQYLPHEREYHNRQTSKPCFNSLSKRSGVLQPVVGERTKIPHCKQQLRLPNINANARLSWQTCHYEQSTELSCRSALFRTNCTKEQRIPASKQGRAPDTRSILLSLHAHCYMQQVERNVTMTATMVTKP